MSALSVRTKSGSTYEIDLDERRIRKVSTAPGSYVEEFGWRTFEGVQVIREGVGFAPVDVPGDIRERDRLYVHGLSGTKPREWIITTRVVETTTEAIA